MNTIKLLFAAFIAIGTTCFAQEKAEQQTIFPDDAKQSHRTKHGFHFVPMQRQTSAMIGISGGTVYDESIFIGIAGYANLTHTLINSGFAAFQLEHLFSTEKLIHYGYNLLAGIGGVKDYEKKTNLFDNFLNLFGTHFYFAQPGLTVELNFTKSLQVNLGAGYRFATGLNESSIHIAKSQLKNEDLNGFSFFLTFKLLGE